MNSKKSITGTSRGDRILVDDEHYVIQAGAGDNKILAGDGNNEIEAADGNDQILVGDGANEINAGGGKNKINAGDGGNRISTGSGNDAIVAGDGGNVIDTGGGKNSIYTGDGDNRIRAGDGSNKIIAGDGNNEVLSGSGNDAVIVGAGSNVINAGSGNNKITASDLLDSVNTITAGSGHDKIIVEDGTSRISAGDGKNTIMAGDGNNSIETGKDADKIIVGDGDNAIDAGAGSNRITTGDGSNRISAGAGSDRIQVGDGANAIAAGDGRNGISTGDGNSQISAGTGDDKILAGDGSNTIDAGAGNNSVTTGDGDNQIATGAGKDRIQTGEGNNSITVAGGANRITAGDGNNVFQLLDGSAQIKAGSGDNQISTAGQNDAIQAGDGDNQVQAGGGNNSIKLGDGSNSVQAGSGRDDIRLGDGDNSVTDLGGTNKISAGDGNNVLQVQDGSAQIKAGGGDNEITAAGLNDVIQAGDGNNRIHAGDGNNRVKLGDGSNIVETGTGKDNLRAGDGDNMIDAGGGDNAVKADHGNNTVQTGAGKDAIQLGDGNNTITSLGGNNKIKVGHGQNAIETGDGADSIKTGNGSNEISTGGGNDRIQTGNGDDRISSGAGDDYVNAGRGYDTVVLSGSFQDYDLDLSRYNGGRGKAYITSRAGSEGDQGTDTLLGVEVLLFEEDGLLLDLNAPAGLQLQDDQITAEGEGPLAISLETLLENDGETRAGTSRVRVDDVSAGGLRVDFDGGIVTYNADDLLQGLKEGDVFEDSFTYYVIDAFGNRSQATVNVALTGENDVPVAGDDYLNGGLKPFGGYTPSPEWTVQGAGAILPWGTTVAGMKDGGYVVVWQAHKAIGTDERSDIWAKIYDADGSVIAETFLVNSFTESYQVDPEVTVLSDGNIVIGWRSNYDADDAKSEFPIRIFDKEGNAVTQELVVNDAADEAVKDVDITALKGGGFVAVWTAYAQETDFRIALFDNNGRKIGDEIVYNLPDIGAPSVPSVIALESGGYAVAWSQPDYEPYYRSGGSKTIKVQLFDETGNTAAAEFDVTKPAGQLDSFPDITEGPDGQLLVVWKFYDPDVSGSTAYFAKIIDQEGKVLVDEFQVHQDAAGGPGNNPPKVAWLDDSNFVFVWGAPGDGDPAAGAWARNPGVWARVFSSEGEPQGDEFVVNQQTMGTQSYYEIEALEGGRFIITWGDNYSGDSVKYTVFEGDGSPVELPYGFEDEVAEIAVLDLLANDSDPDADALTFALAASTSEYGAVVSYDAETDTLFYDPTAAGGIQSLSDGEVLEDSFTYTISDGQGGTSEATVTILVGGLDEADAGAAPLFAQEDYGVLL